MLTIIICVFAIGLVYMFLFAVCKVAGESDNIFESLNERKKKEEELNEFDNEFKNYE